MRTLSSAIVLFSCVLTISLSAFGQDAQKVDKVDAATSATPSPHEASSQASGNDCAPVSATQKEVKWDLIYPASNASYVGGTVPEMHMSGGNQLLRWALLQGQQFRRKGRIALAPGCLLFAFNADKNDGSLKVNANYRILRCSNRVTLSDTDRVCTLAADDKPPASYVLTVPYAKVNVLSRAKYATSDLTSVSTAYATFGGAILTAIASSIHNVSAKEKALGGAAGFLAAYYYFAIARPRMGDNYIAVFVEPPAPQIRLSRQSNLVTVTTSSPHYLLAGEQVQVSDVVNSDRPSAISSISRDPNGIVTVKTDKPHGLTLGALVQIADVPDPSFNGQFQVASATSDTFTYKQKDKPKAPASAGGKVQDVWNGTFVVKTADPARPREFTYWQVGPDEGPIETTGTATLAAPASTNVTVAGNLALSQPADAKPKSADLAGTATLTPPPAKSDELFKKGDLVMFRIPNHHDYYNISMTLSGGTGLTFVSETAEKTGK